MSDERRGKPTPFHRSSLSTQHCYLALDLGTTTLAGRLLSTTGEVVAEARAANPQSELGADILLRLQKAHAGAGPRLQELLIDGLRALVEKLLLLAGRPAAAVAVAAAAGNPGISCLLRNLPVECLLFPPHKPPHKERVHLTVAELDLGLQVPLELFPLVSGFVGGDLVAVLLGVEMLNCAARVDSLNRFSSSTVQRFNNSTVLPGTLIIDLGTNAELGLWDGTRWWVTSAAAGPAFEAGNIGAGMVYGPGAVTDVVLDGDHLRLTTAGDVEPCGLCGSGLVALVAAGLQGGLVDGSGRIVASGEIETNLGRYLVPHADGWAIRFHRSARGELLLTQTDVRNLQFAKGAVLAGVRVLLQQAGMQPDDVSRVLLTGALGTSLPVNTLKRVALLPEPMVEKSLFVANGVLVGLGSYLAEGNGDDRLKSLLDTLQPFPLSGTPAFERLYLASLEF